MVFYSPGVKDTGTGRFLFEETGIREFFLVDSGNLGFGIRNTLELKESGITLTIEIPGSKFHGQRNWIPVAGNQNPESKTVLASFPWGDLILRKGNFRQT